VREKDEEEPLAVGSQMEDRVEGDMEKGEEDARARERKREREKEGRGVEVYNATIAGCDRSCELRAGNLDTVYANLRERVMGEEM